MARVNEQAWFLLDSLEFGRQFALAPSKREKARNEVFSSPDGRFGLRPLTAKDKMAGLEFILSQGPNTSQKVTVEDLAGGKALQMAWTAAGRILVKWWDNLGGIHYYDIGMPQIRLN